MASTLWLAKSLGVLPDPAVFWEALRFPDAIYVDVNAKAVRTIPPSRPRGKRHRRRHRRTISSLQAFGDTPPDELASRGLIR